MGFMLFVDESGHDGRESPYAVLAGVAIEDRDIWNLICSIQDAEVRFFGRRVSDGWLELKGRKLLKTKTFRQAARFQPISMEERTLLARACLERGGQASGQEITALAQAKLDFVSHVLTLCSRFRARAFASIVEQDAPKPAGELLRKDYAYLFERFFYFLEDQGTPHYGFVVFDELEKSQCHILIDQMARYFRETAKGQARAAYVIPEPFFVHSHLTTAVQIADIVAYVVSWAVRFGMMTKPSRQELADLAQQVCQLRYRTKRGGEDGNAYDVWSFTLIDDLRPLTERER